MTLSNDAPAAFPLDNSFVTWTAMDNSGNTISATQTIAVKDTTAPMLVLPVDITREASNISTDVAIGNVAANNIFSVNISVGVYDASSYQKTKQA